MKKVILSFFLLWQAIGFCQEPVYFNNIYNPENTYASGRSILQIDDNYFGIYGTEISSSWGIKLGLFKISNNGNLLDWNIIGETNHHYFPGNIGGTLIKTVDNNLAFALQIEDANTVYGSLIKVNLDLDTIWKKDYYTENDWTMLVKVKQTNDGGYIMVGNVDPGEGYYYDALLLKTDSLGNKQWHQVYGGNFSDRGKHVIETPDGGYLIGGFIWNPSVYHSLDAMLIKTDSLGNEEWTQYYGNPDVDDDMALVAMADDGSYLVTTVYGGTIFAPESRSGRICVLKVDNEGNTIYETKLGPNRLNFHIKNLRKIYDGYMLSGFSKETDTATYQYFSGWMMKLDDNLDSVWYRDYLYEDENWENYFYDAYPTTDNGYIAIGKARPDMGGTNKMWIVKVDSMGCDTPGCATGVSVFEFPETKTDKLMVWPNPAKGWFKVKSSRFKVQGEKVFIIYNSQGIKVEEIVITEAKEPITINIEGWPKGIYFVQLLIEGETLTTKKVIVH